AMVVRRAPRQDGQRPGRRGVVGVAAAAGQQPPIFAPCQRLAERHWSIHGVGYSGFSCRPATMKIWGSGYSCSWRRRALQPARGHGNSDSMDSLLILISVFAVFIPALILPGPDFVA